MMNSGGDVAAPKVQNDEQPTEEATIQLITD
jgi:hypothetical protein